MLLKLCNCSLGDGYPRMQHCIGFSIWCPNQSTSVTYYWMNDASRAWHRKLHREYCVQGALLWRREKQCTGNGKLNGKSLLESGSHVQQAKVMSRRQGFANLHSHLNMVFPANKWSTRQRFLLDTGRTNEVRIMNRGRVWFACDSSVSKAVCRLATLLVRHQRNIWGSVQIWLTPVFVFVCYFSVLFQLNKVTDARTHNNRHTANDSFVLVLHLSDTSPGP